MRSRFVNPKRKQAWLRDLARLEPDRVVNTKALAETAQKKVDEAKARVEAAKRMPATICRKTGT